MTEGLTENNKVSNKQKIYLDKIGLSKKAIEIYEILLDKGAPMTVGEISMLTFDFDSAEYRLLYLMEKKGLVRRIKKRPMSFLALPIKDGLQTALLETEAELRGLLKGMNAAKKAHETVRLVFGRDEVYETYIEYANKAQKQICIYAIGIAYSKQLEKAQKMACERNVEIRHVVQEVKPKNYFVISKWRKLGINLKQLKRSRGYHLVTIDDMCAIITFSNPNNTDERVSMVTTNPTIVELFQHQFEDIWVSAKKIT